jgi:peptidyl-prolyl cis-trans isomerase D
MLKILRDNLKYLSWILWGVILIFVAFVFVDFGGGLSGGRTGRAAAATVGDSQVSYAEFEREYRRLENQYRQAFGDQFNEETAKQLHLPLQALERLVDSKLMLAEAKRLGISATDGEVQQAILDIPGLKDDQGNFVGETIYTRFLRANSMSAREFERSVREQLVIAKVNSLLAASVQIPDADVEKAYRDQSERAQIKYLLLQGTRFAAQVQPTPAELQDYFAAHKDDFRLPVQRVVSYLLVDSVRLRAKMQVEPAEVERYFNEHAAEYAREEQVHARHILVKVGGEKTAEQAKAALESARRRIAGGEDFAKVAAELSDDPGSKTRGGDLGFFGRGRMIKEFEEAAFSAQPNELVGPIQTSFGFHLIQVLEHRAGGQRPLAEVEAQVKSRLAGERADQAAEAKAKELSERIVKEKIVSEAELQKLADNDSITFLTTPPFGKDDSVAGVGRNTPFSGAAFSLKLGEVSPPVKIPRGWALLALKQESPARVPELADVEAKVRVAVNREKMNQLAAAGLASARAALSAGTPIDAVAKSLDLQVQDSGDFGRTGGIQGLGAAPAVAEAALTLPVGGIGGPIPVPAGAVVFQVTSRKTFDPATFAKEKEATRASLERNEVNRLVGSILDQRKRELRVEYDRPLLKSLGILGDDKAGKG